MTIDEALALLERHHITRDICDAICLMLEHEDGICEQIGEILTPSRAIYLAEYSNVSIDKDRFRRDVGDKCTEVDISLLTDTRRFRFELHGFRYKSSNTFHKRILRSIEDFKDPTALAYTIDQYLSLVESEL